MKNGIIQTDKEMIDSEKARKGTKMYRAESSEINDARISECVSRISRELETIAHAEMINLAETEKVKGVTLRYLQSCEIAHSIPSIIGLARACGMTRGALYKFKDEHPNHDTSRWIEMFQDVCADTVAENALKANTNAIFSIFLQKSQYGWKDTVSIEATQSQNIRGEETITPEMIAEKYKGTEKPRLISPDDTL